MIDFDLSKANYKLVKSKVDEIDVDKITDEKELQDLINILLEDNRKNIKSLGLKLQRDWNKFIAEKERVKAMYDFDKSFGQYNIIAGVDEVGRGPLAGPIVACAVILDRKDLDQELICGLNDSKKINEKKREELAEIIKSKALAYHIAECTSEEIDSKGIGVCNNEVFLIACNSLSIKPELVLSDGYKVKGIEIPNESVIKGDTKSACIAAASIVAKVYRDKLMKEFGNKYPYYHFEENVGYGTSKHIDALKEYGPCKIHRMSFLRNIL